MNNKLINKTNNIVRKMREIKYKAFLKKFDFNKKFVGKVYDVDTIELVSKEVVLDLAECGLQGIPFSSIELMQYIWQKDKNGKKIYEGYILLNKSEFKEYDIEDYYYIVCWGDWCEEDGMSSTFVDQSTSGHGWHGRNIDNNNQIDSSGFDELEVVGNIYENSDPQKLVVR